MKLHRRRLLESGLCLLTSQDAFSLEKLPLNNSLEGKNWHIPILEALRHLENKPHTLKCLIPKGCEENLRPVNTILKSHTGIELQLDTVPVDDINTRLMLTNASSSDRYDLALPATFGIPDLASNGFIQPLDNFAKASEPKGFQKDMLYTLGDSFNGKLYGYQTDGDAYLMFFNQTWLESKDFQQRYSDQTGQQLKIPETWEELDTQMRFFHNPKQGRYGGSLFRTPEYLAWEWWVRFHAKGMLPLADDLTPQINNDAGVHALEELISASAYLSPGSHTNGLFDNWREYSQGNSYCNIGWGGTQKYLNSRQSNIRGKLAYSPLPGGIIQGMLVRIPYFNWGWNYTVPTAAQQPEAAYLCALLATTPYVSTLAVREDGYFDPFRASHYEDTIIQKAYSSNFLSAHFQSMQDSIPDFYLLGQSKYMNALKLYLGRALDKKISPQQALQAVSDTWKGLHQRYGRELQAEHWQRIKLRYPKKLQHLLN